MAIEIGRKEHSASELRRLACRAESPAPARRMLAVALVMEGVDRTTAAETCGMQRQPLRDWVHRYNAAGVAGLEDRPRPGRPPRLSSTELDALIEVVEAGPDVKVHRVVRWRCVDLKGMIARRFAVELSERSVGRLLNGRGYARLKPRPRHPKADEAAQAAFKKNVREAILDT
jgi:transposase